MTLAIAILAATSIQLGLGVVTDTQQFGNNAGYACEDYRDTIKFELWTDQTGGPKMLKIWCGNHEDK